MFSKNKAVKTHPGIILGKNNFIPLEKAGNTFVVGSAGFKKGRSYVRPNILQFNSNYIVTDENGEHLHALTPSLLAKGYDVKVISFAPNTSIMKEKTPNITIVNYNPFCYLKDPVDVALMADILSSSIKEPYIKNLCKHLLITCIGYISTFETKKRQSFPVLVEYLKACSNDFFTFKKLFDQSLILYQNPFWLSSYQMFCNDGLDVQRFAIEKLLPYIEPYGLVDEDGSYRFNESDTIELENFLNKPSALFVEISNNNKDLALGQTLLLSQLIHCFLKSKVSNSITHFILDEFFNIPLIPNLHNILAVSKSYNLLFSILCQDMNQLYSAYGEKEAIELLKNCQTQLFFGGYSRDTANYFSAYIERISDYRKNKLKFTSKQLLQYPKDKMLYIQNNNPPIVDEKYVLEKHPNYISG